MSEKLRHQRVNPVIATSYNRGSGKRKLKKKMEEIIKNTHTHTNTFIYMHIHTKFSKSSGNCLWEQSRMNKKNMNGSVTNTFSWYFIPPRRKRAAERFQKWKLDRELTTEMISRGQENDAFLVWREIILILFPTKLKIYCEGKIQAF